MIPRQNNIDSLQVATIMPPDLYDDIKFQYTTWEKWEFHGQLYVEFHAMTILEYNSAYS